METIFRKGSKTFSNSSRFFPKNIREDVIKIYGLVRVADDFVDSIPQKKKEFYDFWDLYKKGLKSGRTGDIVIDSFLDVMKRKDFDERWVDAFFKSMEMDLTKNIYQTEEELDGYLYGSCEVVGLMMARVMGLPKEADVSARNLGKGMQYINFIRDIKEDVALGRNYFPQDDMEEFEISRFSEDDLKRNPENLKKCIRKQACRYLKWMELGSRGFKHIPRRLLIPIKTASDMYMWTAKEISKNPLIVFEKKVKPPKLLILYTGLRNLMDPYHVSSYEKELRKCRYD